MRQLPGLQEAARREPSTVEHLVDCRKCMRIYPATHRQQFACGYELPVIGATAWRHASLKVIRDVDVETGEEVTDAPVTCPGYTTKLPEVIEAAQARMFFSKGELGSFTRGAAPTDQLLAAVTELEIAAGHTQEWTYTPESKGGGANG